MQKQLLNPRRVRRYIKRMPSESQYEQLRRVQKLLRSRRCRSRARTFDLLREMGFEPAWMRVKWTGGVGSYRIMRGGIIRVSVAATRSGVEASTVHDIPIGPGMYDSKIEPGKRHGYRYGYCIEIY